MAETAREEQGDIDLVVGESPMAVDDNNGSSDHEPVTVDSCSDSEGGAPDAKEEEMEAKDLSPPPAKMAKKRGGPTGPRVTKARAPPPISTLSAIRGPPLSSAAARKIMWDQYQPWVMSTYGDAAKTKTITTKKYARIVALLKSTGGSVMDKDGNFVRLAGDPNAPPTGSSSEAAKFKLWVKSKGFHLGPPAGHPDHGLPHTVDMLYLPTGTDKTMDGKVHFVYKKVAMVEQFFDIIYSVHVEAAGDTQIRGRAGKHCGQKRTYRAVADQYAFIPREAISKFLLYCIDCQRKNSLESHGGGRPPKNANQQNKDVMSSKDSIGGDAESDTATADSEHSPPLTMSPLLQNNNGLNNGKLMTPSAAAALSQAMAAMHSLRSMQQARTSLLVNAAHPHSQLLATQAALLQSSSHPASVLLNGSLQKMGAANGNGQDIDLSLPITSTYLRRMRAFGLAAGFDQAYNHHHHGLESNVDKSDNDENENSKREDNEHGGNNGSSAPCWGGFNGTAAGVTGHLAGLLAQNGQNGGSNSPGLSDQTPDNSCQDDASSNGAKDEDDDDDDDEDKLDGIPCGDPEKLKAFNMFVRLFVDENLDRHVPISKQPKEKIQAIIDSCTRQFPEYASRARKRIRTYLKSCRRTKRSREQAGLDGSNARPTPPHLTSVQAEQLLARACENESENAKRMRMGLEPISQPMPVMASTPSIVDVLAATTHATSSSVSSLFPNMSAVTDSGRPFKTEYKPEQLASLLQAAASQHGSTTLTSVMTSAASSQPMSVTPTSGGFPGLNGTSLYRQSFGQANGNASFPPTAGLLQNQSSTLQNGPSMDSLKKQPLLNHKLNATETAAVRQLVTGYRESAAFLLRSADELEHLLQIQPKL